MLIVAVHQILHNHDREFITTNEINPATGLYKLKGVTKTLEPDVIYDLPDDLCAELLGMGTPDLPVARLPDEREVQVWKLANGYHITRGDDQ